MAIAVDSTSEGASGGPTLTYAHNVGAGSNRLLLVGAYVSNQDTTDISGITYNGVPMDLVGTPVVETVANLRLKLYALENPDSGNNNVIISTSSGSPNLRAVSISLTGAAQSTSLDNYATKQDTTSVTSYSHSLTPVADNSWIFMWAKTDQVMTATNSAVLRDEHTDQNFALFDTNGAITPAASTTLGVSYSIGSTQHALMLASVAPFDAGGGALPFITRMDSRLRLRLRR